MVHHFIDTFSVVNALLNETFLNRDHSVVLHISSHINEESVDDQVKDLVDLEVINLYLLLAILEQKVVREGIKDLRIFP